MASINFGSGITGISNNHQDPQKTDYPTNKSNIKPPGDKVIDYTGIALEKNQSWENRERLYATNIPGVSSFSPEEHHQLTKEALQFLQAEKDKVTNDPKKAEILNQAIDVITNGQNDSNALMMYRTLLIAT